MAPDRPDVVTWGSRASPRRTWWAVAVVSLAVALAAAITLAVHYHGQVVALRHRLHAPPASHQARSVPPTLLSSTTVRLPADSTLKGAVTVFAAKSSSGHAQIMLSASITGGSPDTGYTLLAFDCIGTTGYQSWAVGSTNSLGTGRLTGPTLPVFLADKYWLYLMPSSGASAGPGLLGTFSATGRFSASAAGNPACP